MINRPLPELVLAFCLMACCDWGFSQDTSTTSENWSRFRGPNGSGICTEHELPTDLAVENAAWSVPLAGEGHSSPVIWGDHIWVTCYDKPAEQLRLDCFDKATGASKWNWTMPLKTHPMHQLNCPATSTPAVDEKHVYLLAAEPDHLYVIAIDHAGNEKWRRDYGAWIAQHGFGTSPIVCDGKVVFCNSQESFRGMPAPGNSVAIAVNCVDGTDAWTADLADDKACYAVPAIWADAEKRDWIIGSTVGDGVFSLDAKTGTMAWQEKAFKQRTVGSPVIIGDSVLANNGSGAGGNSLVKIDLSSENHPIQYQLNYLIGYVPTVIALDNMLFMFNDNGIGSCLDLEDGSDKWRGRISDGFASSPVSDGRNIYCLSKNGSVFVIGASVQFKAVGQFPLGAPSQATAAISAGRIYFRTREKLWCFGPKKGAD